MKSLDLLGLITKFVFKPQGYVYNWGFESVAL